MALESAQLTLFLLKMWRYWGNLRFFHENDDDDSVESARKFALLLYGQKVKNVKSLNELRYRLATTTDKSTSMLPLTDDAFKQHIFRAKYQARIWCESHIAMPQTTKCSQP